jgi:alpha-amylase/alpha-mannosidase (GH57 family)
MYDLLTWYHLSWLGETVRRESGTFSRLVAVAGGFTLAHRTELLRLIGREVADVIPRHRRLAALGKVELSTTPHCHPLSPLLIDFRSARDALPDAPLPVATAYPGGAERVALQIADAIESHTLRFGARPAGMWPAEGAVSEAMFRQIAQREFLWTASSESVLANTIRHREGRPYLRAADLHRPYRLAGAPGELVCFFRDEHLSDLIGFQYATWRGEDAAAHLVGELEVIAASAPVLERPVVSIILDGENAWESYPYNGFYFLSSLYDQLESHPLIRTHTYQSYLALRAGPPPPVRIGTEAAMPAYAAVGELRGLVAGSWVYGNLSTWIGSPDKNRAWDLLVAAKQGFDTAMSGDLLSSAEREAARRQLSDCEGSDWFWWFGDYNAVDAVAYFDRLYRLKLSNLYRLLRLQIPAELSQPISTGKGHAESGGTMRRAT